jgi:hypothetical protein
MYAVVPASPTIMKRDSPNCGRWNEEEISENLNA